MATHHIYETKAFVLSAFPSGEADRYLILYTREFGLVRASALGLREIKSKLRYSLQPFSLSVVNLVRGRTGWRVVNARLLMNYFSEFRGAQVRQVVLARAFLLLKRLLHGEERNENLFTALLTGFTFLAEVADESLAEAELLLALRILHHLGYVGESPMLSSLLVSATWNLEAVAEARRQRIAAVRTVNESLRASQL